MTRILDYRKQLTTLLTMTICFILLVAFEVPAQQNPVGNIAAAAKSDKSIWDDAEENDASEDTLDEAPEEMGNDKDPWAVSSAAAPWEESGESKKMGFGGRVLNKLAVDTNEDNAFEDLYQNHLQIELNAGYRFTSAIEAKIGVGGDYYIFGRDSDWDSDSNLRLFDAYLNFSGHGYNLKIGNQIVRWGKSDGYSPLDNVNPEDLRDGIGDRRENRKWQIPMLNLELFTGPVTLQGLYIPVFIKSRYDVNQTDWALFNHYAEEIGGFGTEEEEPDKNFKNGEAGIRLSGIVGKLDYAFSYLHAFEDVASLDSLETPSGFVPVFSSRVIRDLALFAQATGQNIRLSHQRQNIYGFEFETTLAAFGVRGDLAYTDKTSFTTEQLQRINKPVWQYVVGVDYNGPGAFYVNLQFGQSFIQDFEDVILLADEISSSISGTVSKEFFNGNQKLEFRYYYDFDGDGALYNPKWILKYWQNVRLELGVEIFDGTDAHPLGFYRDNDQAYAMVEWLF